MQDTSDMTTNEQMQDLLKGIDIPSKLCVPVRTISECPEAIGAGFCALQQKMLYSQYVSLRDDDVLERAFVAISELIQAANEAIKEIDIPYLWNADCVWKPLEKGTVGSYMLLLMAPTKEFLNKITTTSTCA